MGTDIDIEGRLWYVVAYSGELAEVAIDPTGDAIGTIMETPPCKLTTLKGTIMEVGRDIGVVALVISCG